MTQKENKYARDMSKVDMIVLHCSASDYFGHDDIEIIREWHKARGFRDVGYNYFIKKSGIVQIGRPITETPAHVKGLNYRSIGICLSGRDPKAFTEKQYQAAAKIIRDLVKEYEIKYIIGHRDCSVDLNEDGIIEHREWCKTCPNFEVALYLKYYLSELDGHLDHFVRDLTKKQKADREKALVLAAKAENRKEATLQRKRNPEAVPAGSVGTVDPDNGERHEVGESEESDEVKAARKKADEDLQSAQVAYDTEVGKAKEIAKSNRGRAANMPEAERPGFMEKTKTNLEEAIKTAEQNLKEAQQKAADDIEAAQEKEGE